MKKFVELVKRYYDFYREVFSEEESKQKVVKYVLTFKFWKQWWNELGQPYFKLPPGLLTERIRRKNQSDLLRKREAELRGWEAFRTRMTKAQVFRALNDPMFEQWRKDNPRKVEICENYRKWEAEA